MTDALLEPGSLALVIWAIGSAIIWIGIPVGIFVTVRRFLRAYELRSAAPTEIREIRERMQNLEEQVADLTIENDRLRSGESTGQRLPPSDRRD